MTTPSTHQVVFEKQLDVSIKVSSCVESKNGNGQNEDEFAKSVQITDRLLQKQTKGVFSVDQSQPDIATCSWHLYKGKPKIKILDDMFMSVKFPKN